MIELTFNWTGVAPDCTDIQYNVTSDCGQCSTITKLTMVVCKGYEVSNSGHICSFMVKTVVCGNNTAGSDFECLYVKLKGISQSCVRFALVCPIAKLLILVPDPPKIAVYPMYSAETGRLTSLKTEWMELVNLNVFVVHT